MGLRDTYDGMPNATTFNRYGSSCSAPDREYSAALDVMFDMIDQPASNMLARRGEA